MKDKDWLIVKSVHSNNNPMIIQKKVIQYILPDVNNQLKSCIYLSETDVIFADEPTSSIEERL